MKSDKKTIDEILNRGVVVDVLPSIDEFKKKLLSGEKIKIYLGADPTSKSLHLSHAKNYILLEEFRTLGHEVVVLVGDFTARIGDPTDKSTKRQQLSKADVKNNVKTWIKQISPLIKIKGINNPAKIVHNSKWLSKLKMEDVIDLASNFTVQHMLERDMFEKRMKESKPIHMHEFMYPLMQGYDSVALNVDAELCGTDQTFNALIGRTLLKRKEKKNKFVLVVNLMENPKTGELMSKSRGTGVFLDSSASEMYGAIMSQPDEMIEVFLINCTRIPLSEINNIKIMKNKRDAKMRTAFEVVKKIYGEKKAKEAQDNFIETFQKKGIPEIIKEVNVEKEKKLMDVLFTTGIVKSKSDFRRLVKEGAVKHEDGSKVNDEHYFITQSEVFKIGKRRFVKVKIV